jgi:hypothetical protein
MQKIMIVITANNNWDFIISIIHRLHDGKHVHFTLNSTLTRMSVILSRIVPVLRLYMTTRVQHLCTKHMLVVY